MGKFSVYHNLDEAILEKYSNENFAFTRSENGPWDLDCYRAYAVLSDSEDEQTAELQRVLGD